MCNLHVGSKFGGGIAQGGHVFLDFFGFVKVQKRREFLIVLNEFDHGPAEAVLVGCTVLSFERDIVVDNLGGWKGEFYLGKVVKTPWIASIPVDDQVIGIEIDQGLNFKGCAISRLAFAGRRDVGGLQELCNVFWFWIGSERGRLFGLIKVEIATRSDVFSIGSDELICAEA